MPYLVIDPAAAQAAPVVTFGAPEAAGAHPMGKSLLGLRTRLILETGNRSDIPDAQWNEWINDAYVDFYNSLELPEANKSFGLTMAANQPFYLLPATVHTVRQVSATDPTFTATGGVLDKLDIFSYRRLPIRTGQPEGWLREQNVLVFWPTPDKAYTVAADVRIQPAPLTLDAHYPALEDKWHEPLFLAAKYRAWTAVQNDTKSLITQNEMSRQIGRKNDRDEQDDEVEFPAMRPVFSRRDMLAIRRNPRNVEPGE